MRRSRPPEGEGEQMEAADDESVGGTPGHGASDDAGIIAAMRRGSASAFEAYVDRFHRVLLDYARRGGLLPGDSDHFVEELLHDVALELMSLGAAIPRNPRMYLIAACRNRLLNVKRGRMRRERTLDAVLHDARADSQLADDRDVVAGCSEGMVRESRGPGWERVRLPVALMRLAARLGEALTVDERRLLVAVAENVPQREIAVWLGLSHVAARKRLERLRARMTEVAMRYTNSLEPDEARELHRFFERCRARIGTGISAAPRSDPQSARDARASGRSRTP